MEALWVALLAGAVSAVVSGLVSLVVVSQRTALEHRARRADAAKRALAERVGPLLHQVAVHRRLGTSAKRQDSERAHLDDVVLAAGIREIATDLSWYRRWRVERRVRRLVGQGVVDLSSLIQGEDLDAQEVRPGVLAGVVKASRPGTGIDLTDGLLHRAMSTAPDSPLVARLEKELERLARAR